MFEHDVPYFHDTQNNHQSNDHDCHQNRYDDKHICQEIKSLSKLCIRDAYIHIASC